MKCHFDNLDPVTRNFLASHAEESAAVVTTPAQRFRYLALGIALLLLLKYRWDWFLLAFSLFFLFWYGAAAFFRGGAALLSLFGCGETRISDAEAAALRPEELPVYTILLPLYHESNIAGKLVRNIGRLDYPAEKLDVKLLLESDDAETRRALESGGLPPYCELVVIPDAPPKTKPRACNFGLERARGEFCVIYDAEDAPEPDQLRKAVALFRRDPECRILCAQAKLNYYNAGHNLLTRLFTVEYSAYFDLTLSGYQLFRLPLPLGGTSNHFRTELLRQAGPWDPFNVTEDCDLGLKIYERGFRTTLFNSTTYEEANSELGNWLRQRSRWVKGFCQTHLVHYRNPFRAVRRLGWYGAFGGFLAVGGSALMMLCNPFFWAAMLLYAGLLTHGLLHGVGVAEQIAGPHLDGGYQGIAIGAFHLRAWPLFYDGPSESPLLAALSKLLFAGSLALFLANGLFLLTGVIACVKRRNFNLIGAALLMPFYWILISIAAWKGFLQLFTRPFYWEKTRHGLTKQT